MKLGRKILLMLLAIFATTVVAAGIYLTTTYNYATGELSKTFRASKATSGNSKAIQQTKPITILLMGVDTGSKERKETWEGNSDTMILVTVNPKTKKTTMTSLERDLLTDIEGSGEAKLNSAYAEGGADLAISTIQKVLDIDIDYYALINMQGMIDLVDAVGGIEVTNHFDFPISIAENEPEFQAKVEPGTHKINGEQALVYSRMRYDDPDGDYGRQKRQREVIQKVVAKLLKMDSIGSYKKILSAVSSNVQTSIDLGDTNTLRSLMGYSDALKNIKSYQLAGSDAMINGGSYQVASTEDILKVHAKKIRIADDIDFNKIARMAAGASGAELANIVNEAALRAVRDGRSFANESDMEESIEVVIAGYQKKNAILSDKEKLVVSYHEIGHALVAALQDGTAPVQKITIIPRTSGALGYTMQVDKGNHYLVSKEELMSEIATLCGGRAAEEVEFRSVSTGASNDIEKATKLARQMITQYGMSSEFGMVALETVNNQYLGGDSSLACSPDTQTKIDQQVVSLVEQQHQKAIRILTENKHKMDELAQYLYEKETITGDEFMDILNRKPQLEDKTAEAAAEKTEREE